MACSKLSVAVSVCVLQTWPLCSSSREDKLSTVLQEAVICVTRTSLRVAGVNTTSAAKRGEEKGSYMQ